jgi:hypothetical protein
MPTPEQAQRLSDAMWQLLDDMGEIGLCMCGHAKAQVRIAYEPFRLAETEELGEEVPCDMPLAEAEAIVEDVRRRT